MGLAASGHNILLSGEGLIQNKKRTGFDRQSNLVYLEFAH